MAACYITASDLWAGAEEDNDLVQIRVTHDCLNTPYRESWENCVLNTG